MGRRCARPATAHARLGAGAAGARRPGCFQRPRRAAEGRLRPLPGTRAATAANSYEAAHDASTASAAQQAVASFYLAAIAERAGDIEGALAAYNGGPANARRWREQQRWSGSDGYVAAVDFAETRLYLERVLANYEWYRYYHGAAPGPAIR